MDASKLRAITNNYQDVHLLSLKDWKHAREFEDRDQGGPYMVSEEGYDPRDLRSRLNEFVLGKSGQWVDLSTFFSLPADQRRSEFIFSSAAEVMGLMSGLPQKATIRRQGETLPVRPGPPVEDQDELNEAVIEARNKLKTDSASPVSSENNG